MTWDTKELAVSCARLQEKSEKLRDIATFPQYKERYIQAFDKMLQARKEAGKNDLYDFWTDGEGVFRWWIEDKTIPGQIKFDFSKAEKEKE